jgi:branched-chain amino acid transport system substrate-binding protein
MHSSWSKVLALAAGLAVAGSAAAQEKVIKIGTLFPLTGPVAVAGTRCKAAVETMAEVINNKHPEINVPLAKQEGILGGYKIVLVHADHQSKPDVAKSEAERLFNQEGVFAIIGSYNSSATKPASAVAERLGKIFIAGSSSSAALTERGLRNFFRLAVTDRVEAAEFVEYFQEVNKTNKGGIKTAGLIYENTEFGKHAAEEAKAACKAAGIQVVAEAGFTPGATNLNSEIQTLKAKSPDAIFGAALGADYALMVRTMKQAAFRPKAAINFCTGYQDPIIAKQLGADGDFFMGGNAYSPELAAKYMKNVAPVEAIYKQKTGVVFDGDAIQEAIALSVLAQAIEKAGSLDTKKVVDILHGTTFESPLSLSGKVAFGEDGQNKLAKSVLTQLSNLNYVPVFPASYAEGKPTFPMPPWK